MKFKTTLQLSKKTATGIHVSDEIVEVLGGGSFYDDALKNKISPISRQIAGGILFLGEKMS